MTNVDLSNWRALRSSIKKGLQYLKPPDKLLPSEFAEKYLRIPSGNALPGPIRFRNAPHQVEPLNLIKDPTCDRVSLMWGAQTGKTQVALMAQAYFIGWEPKAMMAMQASKTDVSKWLNLKFDPMIASTPLLEERVAKPRGREGVNNQEMKTFPGGALTFAWSGSPKTMRGVSAGIIFPDETDGYDKTKEGHPVSLLSQRAATFGDDKLIFETSTPTLKGSSYIESAFEEGDQRRWNVDCPDCGHTQFLKWSQVKWMKDDDGEHDPSTARYVCEECGSLWDDSQRIDALTKGRWIAAKKFKGHASFHLPEMASCFVRLKDIVTSFLTKKAINDLQTFTNVSLAETWEIKGLKTDPQKLYERREHYPAEVPEKVRVLTAAVDVQDDRLELKVEGWGKGQENWKIDYRVFRGNLNDFEVWDRLEHQLGESYQHESGLKMHLSGIMIDTGGHFTQQTYDYVNRSRHNVIAIKGSSSKDANLVGMPNKNNLGNVNLYSLGVHKLKMQILQRTGIQKPGAGYVHFPVSDQFEIDYFNGYTAEELKWKYDKGVRKEEFIKIRPRNEPFDLAVYNLACIILLDPNFDYEEKQHENRLYHQKTPELKQSKPKSQNTGGWVDNYENW